MWTPVQWMERLERAPASPEADAPWPGRLAGVPRTGSGGAGKSGATKFLTHLEAAAIAALLRHRFEDGRVYARGRDDRRLLRKAVHCGLVDAAGFPTTSGENLLHAHRAARTPAPGAEPDAPPPATRQGRRPTT